MAAGVECPRDPNQARRLRTREPGTTLSPDVSGVFFVSVINASYSGRHTEACRPLAMAVWCRVLQGHDTTPESAVAEDRAKRRRCPILVSEDDDRVDFTPLEPAATAEVRQL